MLTKAHQKAGTETQNPEAVRIECADGVVLGGHLWAVSNRSASATVIINPATGVAARYYRFYAEFLVSHGFDVLTYDYRGIGNSRPENLRRTGYRWHDWGEKDFAAALDFVLARDLPQPIHVVGHSFGGVAPGFAANAGHISRMLTVGAQYAWWRDYKSSHKLSLLAKWHFVMPALTLLCGYFPGRKLGWLEDLPARVALDWALMGKRLENTVPSPQRAEIRGRFAEVSADILAITLSDDELGTPQAVARTLSLYSASQRQQVLLEPKTLGYERIGHFDLFHNRHAAGFWIDSLLWLRDGLNPWPANRINRQAF
ncbi:alpha/beta fold hydrolase [Brucellaceae bacterium D45D]